MKYWVYKESRILGPFDKEAVSGLPGLDSGTLVCAGDPAGGAWVPAGELADLSGVPSGLSAFDEVPSSTGLLDQLQIDSAGLVGADEFPESFASELFQDAAFKKDFRDILTTRGVPDETEARRARDKISELTAQLEAMYRHVSELEAGQTDLARRLAAKELELRGQEAAARVAAALTPPPAAPAEGAAAARTFLSPAPPPIPGGPPPVAAVPVPPSAELPNEWPQIPATAGGFPSFGGGDVLPPSSKSSEPGPALPALPESVAPALPESVAPALPDIPTFAASSPPAEAIPPAATFAPPEPAPDEPPKSRSFGKAKSFKVVPVVKSFKVLDPGADATGGAANPVPEFKFEQSDPPAEVAPVAASIPAPLPVMPPPAPVAPPPAPVPEPINISPVVPPPVVPTPVVPPPVVAAPPPIAVAAPTPEPAQIVNPFSAPPDPLPSIPTPSFEPPNTLSRAQATLDPVPAFGTGAEAAPADGSVAARFAKPQPAPPTGEVKKPGRNNKAFLIAGGVLLTLLVILGVIFMRQPKEDLRQMATLDDGQAPIGLSPDEGADTPPPIVKPTIAEAPPAPAPAPPPGPPPEHAAAIETVKDFPLDGDRGTVGRWLQYSYTASPGAGVEEWNASSTSENTVLVEYRLVPNSTQGKGALYLFEVDPNGIVMGKNIEARQMLAGSPPPEAPKVKKKPVKKAAPRRRPVVEEPKEVPLLPLPDSGELRPPAEDDGSFGSDTINSGI